jgi:uncharacterized protein with FMN-binding domain
MTMRQITLAVVLAAGTTSAIAAGSRLLSPDEIKASFGKGTPFAAVSKSGRAYSFTFKADGSAVQLPKGQTNGTVGKWRLSAKGYCTVWGSGKEHCYLVDKNGNEYDVRDTAGSLIATWSLPIPSNTMPAPTAAVVPPVRSAPVEVLTTARPVLSAPAGAGYVDGAYAGAVEDAYYGHVQIQAVVQGGRLIGIKILQYPSDRRTSIAINRYALPTLRNEVIKAQSASIDIVSGATLTSKAFIHSLTDALNQAKG